MLKQIVWVLQKQVVGEEKNACGMNTATVLFFLHSGADSKVEVQ